ncbi:MAG: repeat protein [Mycobacterium sp.]|nr:repeat protein [Mycobacterium sp.]
MPNRRRRKLSTAMSAVAALAVASPIAVVAVSELSANANPAPQHREFVAAAVVTDLPNELMSALSQGLSQFGINMPPLPTSLTGGSSAPAALTSPGLTTPGLTTPGLTTPGLTTPGLTTPGLTTPGLTSPGVSVPPVSATAPSLTDPGLTNPALTSPIGANPALTSPIGATPGLTAPGEVPISAPIGLGPSAGTYPILGDPSLAAAPASGGGGLMSDLGGAASSLGINQVMDLLKGVMPMIMSAAQPVAAAAPAPDAPALPPVPANLGPQ